MVPVVVVVVVSVACRGPAVWMEEGRTRRRRVHVLLECYAKLASFAIRTYALFLTYAAMLLPGMVLCH
jgi:hypothetical protein